MDGWGKGQLKAADAIQHAKVPFVNSLYVKYPNSELVTYGEDVGLPLGQMGNSEVGHLNIGAGRIVYQELQRINVAIAQGELSNNKAFQNVMTYSKANKKTLHLIGLLSDGGVHSHINHLKAICDVCKNNDISNVKIHVITDGRDTDPKSGLKFLKELQKHLQHSVGEISTLTGRYFAMDRDERWERVKLAYDAMVHGVGIQSKNIVSAMEENYANGITDEFLKPIIVVNENNQPVGSIQEGDAVLCFNFRTDRCREITEALTQQDFPTLGMKKLNLFFSTLTEYNKNFKNVYPLFTNNDLKNTLGEVLATNNKKQIRIAETEKYPHVTFFFSGGREKEFDGETRIMKASPKDVATYDLKPAMSAHELTEAILPEIKNESADFICMNFANADMVGHTGVWQAVITAVETVDECLAKIVPIALAHNYTILLTADHGNSDFMINDDGSPNTAHTMNPVPFFVISNDFKSKVKNGKLADIAPTILHIMQLPIPKEMTGNILT
jgi:2,3-bisphosphoglycerate-independent phosphoglycerate mutase